MTRRQHHRSWILASHYWHLRVPMTWCRVCVCVCVCRGGFGVLTPAHDPRLWPPVLAYSHLSLSGLEGMCACVYVCVSLGVMCQRCTSRCPLRSTSAYVASVFAMLCDTGLYRIVQGGTSVGWVQGGLVRSCLVGVAYTSTTICNKGVLVPLVCRDMSCGDTSLMSLSFRASCCLCPCNIWCRSRCVSCGDLMFPVVLCERHLVEGCFLSVARVVCG